MSRAHIAILGAAVAAAEGKWAHPAKVAFEKNFLGKIRRGESETFYERLALDLMGARKIKAWAERWKRRRTSRLTIAWTSQAPPRVRTPAS